MQFIIEYYLWFMSLHCVAFVSWMAGLFYLPRLFVYHKENLENSSFTQIVKLQEKRLYFYIQTPAMILTLLSGILMLIANPSLLSGAGFMHAKLSCVFLLLLYHFHNYFCMKHLANHTCTKSSKFFRIYNEIPTLLLIVIVVMIIIRPF